MKTHWSVTTILLVLILAAIAYSIFKTRHSVMIEGFNVPKEIGIDSNVMGDLVRDAMRRLEDEAHSKMKKDKLLPASSDEPTTEITIKGVKLPLRALVETLASPMGIHPMHIKGSVVLHGAAPSSQQIALVIVQLVQGGDEIGTHRFTANANSVDDLTQDIAAGVVEKINPYILAVYRYDHKDFDKSVELSRNIAGDSSEDGVHRAAALNLWGNVLARHELYRDAADKYQEAIAVNSHNSEAYYNLGLIREYERSFQQAETAFKKAIECDPKDPTNYTALSDVFRQEQQYDDAVRQLKKAITLDEAHSSPAYDVWGTILTDQKLYDQANEMFKTATDKDKSNAQAYIDWGGMLSEKGMFNESDKKFQQAVDIDPSDSYPYIAWGMTLNQRGSYDRAADKFQNAVRLNPLSPTALFDWGLALLHLSKYPDAADKFQKVVDINTQNIDALFLWGQVLMQQGKYREAAAKFRTALAIDPSNAPIDAALKDALKKQNKYRAASTPSKVSK